MRTDCESHTLDSSGVSLSLHRDLAQQQRFLRDRTMQNRFGFNIVGHQETIERKNESDINFTTKRNLLIHIWIMNMTKILA